MESTPHDQLGRLRLLPARPAVTQIMVLLLGLMSDRECPCLTDRSGTQHEPGSPQLGVVR
jgi:hypothetical protein